MMITRAVVWTCAALFVLSVQAGIPNPLNTKEKGIFARQLLQDGGESNAVLINEKNAKNFPKLVREAESGTVFVVADSRLILKEPLEISKPVTIRGASPKSRPVIKCKGRGTRLDVSSGDVFLKDFILRDCEGPAVRVDNPTFDVFGDPTVPVTQLTNIEVENVDFLNNKQNTGSVGFALDGGGLGVGGACVVSVKNCLFERNTAILGGGIAAATGASLSVIDSIFRENEVEISGGGMSAGAAVFERGFETFLTVTNCIFERNRDFDGSEDKTGLLLQGVGSPLETSQFLGFPAPQTSGGAIYVIGFDDVKIENCTFDGNSAVPAAGAIFVGDNKFVHLERNVFENNFVMSRASGERTPDLELGGAVYVSFLDQTSGILISKCEFVNNTAAYGGGLHMVMPLVLNGNVKLEECLFEGNTAFLGGGGAVIRNTIQIDIDNMKMRNNRAVTGGGLMLTNGAGAFFTQGLDTSRDSEFEGNIALDGGAWFFLGAGQVTAQNVLFKNNKAQRNGGAVALVESLASGYIGFQDSLLEDNSAQRGGAIFMDSIGFLDMKSTHAGLNKFRRNRALAGGALYLRTASQVKNEISIVQAQFDYNQAGSNLSDELLNMALDIPTLGQDDAESTEAGKRGLLQDGTQKTPKKSSDVLDVQEDDPCNPGGGGAMCLVLSQVPERATVGVQIWKTEFRGNGANTGGGVFIAMKQGSGWKAECPAPTNSLASVPCKRISLLANKFNSNRADGAGGAIFATDSSAVFYDDSEKELPPFDFKPLSESANLQGFVNNTVGEDGYGPDLSSNAVQLILISPQKNSEGLVVPDHASGNQLPPITLAVVDAYGEIVSSGISDSILKVEATSDKVSGQRVSAAVSGVIVFDSLTVVAEPGVYDLIFAADGLPPITIQYSIRTCMVGEFNVTGQTICTNCPSGFYGLDPSVPCQQCDDKANCTGGPALIPRNGFWHSTPFSPQFHECLTADACSYENRNEKLGKFYNDRLTLVPSNESVSSDLYPQCNEGYRGVLCGSCVDNYGHFAGGECVKCYASRRATALFIFLVSLWTLGLLGFTIRSSLSSIRDFNEMRTIAAQTAARRQAARGLPSPDPDQENGHHGHGEQVGLVHMDPLEKLDMYAEKMNRSQSHRVAIDKSPRSATAMIDHILAAEKLAETVKIATNFLQVTSVAVEINADWTSSIENMLVIQDILAGFSNGSSLVAMDCVLDHTASIPTSIRALILRIFFPLVLFLIVVATFFMYWLYLRHKRSESISYFKSRTIISLLVVLFFAYEEVTQELMRTLNCLNVDLKDFKDETGYSEYANAKGLYWGEDTSLQCYKGAHAQLVGIVGVPGLLIFSFGIPTGMFIFLLWKKRKNQLMEQEFLNTYGFVYQNYSERFVYWEVTIMLRKALIGGIVVFAYPLGANLQGVLSLGLLIVSLALHLVARPYKYRMLNLLEGASLLVSIFNFYSAIVFNDANTSAAARVLLSILLVLLNVGLVMLMIFKGVQEIDKFVKAHLRRLNVPLPKSFVGRSWKFFRVMVSKAAEKAQEQSKANPVVRSMSRSIRALHAHSSRRGRSGSSRKGGMKVERKPTGNASQSQLGVELSDIAEAPEVSGVLNGDACNNVQPSIGLSK